MLKSRLWGLIFIGLVYWGGLRLSNFVTDGFYYSNIIYDLPYDLKRAVAPPSDEKKEQIQSILSQPFSYLGKGHQSYVFESSDGKYVLKFFKYQRFRALWWAYYFGWIPPVNENWEVRNTFRKNKLERLFGGCKIAYEDLSDLTGVLYVKLDDSPSPITEVVVFDTMGIAHKIPMDDRQFIIQIKAEPIEKTLRRLLKEKQHDQVQTVIVEMAELLINENRRGFIDLDPAIINNTALLNGHPLHIDVGQFVKIDESITKDFLRKDFLDKTGSFLKFIRDKDSSLADQIELEVQALMVRQGL